VSEIDLAKNSFYAYRVDAQGKRIVSRKVRRKQFSIFMANLPPCLVAMKACGSSHD
jgi:transposase